MSLIKYRIHEVAKDFNVASKVISQILTDYIAPPKNHMQVLETPELDVIFEYMTQHNQAESLEEIFKTPAKPEAPAKEKSEAKAADYVLLAKSDMASFVDSLVAPLSLINALLVAIARRKSDVVDHFERLEHIWQEYGVFVSMEEDSQ